MGYHLDQAVRYRDELGIDDELTRDLRNRTAEHLSRAGARATDRADPLAAVRFLGRAVELRRALGAPPLDVLIELGIGYLDMNRAVDAVRILGEARHVAEQAGDLGAATRADALIALGTFQSDPTYGAERVAQVADAAIETLQRTGDDRGLADAWIARASADLSRSRWLDATRGYQRALEHVRKLDMRGMADLIALWLANALVWGPTPVGEALERLAGLQQTVRGRRAHAELLSQEGNLRGLAGQTEAAWALKDRAAAEIDELGLRGIVTASHLGSALIASVAGDHERALAELSEGRANLQRLGETATRSTVEAYLALALARLGRDAEAIDMSEISERNSAADDVASQTGWRLAGALRRAHASVRRCRAPHRGGREPDRGDRSIPGARRGPRDPRPCAASGRFQRGGARDLAERDRLL